MSPHTLKCLCYDYVSHTLNGLDKKKKKANLPCSLCKQILGIRCIGIYRHTFGCEEKFTGYHGNTLKATDNLVLGIRVFRDTGKSEPSIDELLVNFAVMFRGLGQLLRSCSGVRNDVTGCLVQICCCIVHLRLDFREGSVGTWELWEGKKIAH